MFTGATPTSVPHPPHHFRRHWWRTVIPSIFMVAVFGLFAYRIPGGFWFGAATLCLSLLLCPLLHGGLLISNEGIAWYMLRPHWSYRVVPWQAVIDVRKPLFGILGGIRLIVVYDRYEPWVWGTPQQDREMEIDLRPRGYAGGEAIWDVIHQFWSPRGRVADFGAVDGQGAEPGLAFISRGDSRADEKGGGRC